MLLKVPMTVYEKNINELFCIWKQKWKIIVYLQIGPGCMARSIQCLRAQVADLYYTCKNSANMTT